MVSIIAIYVKIIAILVIKQISFNSFKNEITDKLILHIKYIFYIYLCKCV